jgi:hypothetical protein
MASTAANMIACDESNKKYFELKHLRNRKV